MKTTFEFITKGLAAKWRLWLRVQIMAPIMASLLVTLSACGGGGSSSAPESMAPPLIVEPPRSVAVTEGEPAQFAVRATGSALRYQWQRNGTDIPAATNPALRLDAVNATDNNSRFQVRISNASGTSISSDATLVVSPKPVAPLLTLMPQGQWVIAGQPAVFAAEATGSGPLTFQWLRDGQPIAGANQSVYSSPTALSDDGARISLRVSNVAGSVTSPEVILRVTAVQLPPVIVAAPADVQAVVGGTALFAVSASGTGPFEYQWLRNGAPIVGANSAQLAIMQVQMADNNAQFSVRVNNTAGSVQSTAALLLVSAAAVAPSFSQQPQSVSVNPSGIATFTAQADGTAPLGYQWFKNGVAISGATSATHTVIGAQISDNGASFSVQVSNTAGVATSLPATLAVTDAPVAPSIGQPPLSATVTAGGNAAFYAIANGTAPLSYQWTRNGAPISGATQAIYVLSNVSAADNGAQFRLVVTNAAGQATSEAAVLTVLPVLSAPAISAHPQSQAMNPGATAQFNVVASGSGPLSYQWYRDGTAIGGATAANYSLPNVGLADDGATFSVVVTNTVGTVTSSSATLRVTAAAVPPTITAQPQPQSVADGGTVAFSVTASGSAPFTYQWLQNGVPIVNATSGTYIHTASLADNGNTFSVEITNAAGTATSTAAVLSVMPLATAPVINMQPQSVNAQYGSTVVLTIGATGSGPLTYQWLRDGVAIPGASQDTFTLPIFELSDIGARFSVVVANSAGVVVSSLAQLSLAPSDAHVEMGSQGYALALAFDGTVYGWGVNGQGQLGLGDKASRAAATQIPGLAHIRKISASFNHSAALRADGALFMWGANGRGQLGNGSNNESLVPQLVATNIKDVELGHEYTLALTQDGTLISWGRNDFGQLGNGTYTDSASQVIVASAAGLVNIAALVSDASSGSYAITNDGTVFAWGENTSGKLGLGDKIHRNVPTLAAALENVIQLAAGTNFAVALHVDGTVSSWGNNNFGQLGNSGVPEQLVPGPVSGVANAIQVDAGRGNDASFALLANGSILAWGSNLNGQLGDGNTVDRSTPSATLIADAVRVSIGNGTGLAILVDGQVLSWGQNTDSELGRGLANAFEPVPGPVSGVVLLPAPPPL